MKAKTNVCKKVSIQIGHVVHLIDISQLSYCYHDGENAIFHYTNNHNERIYINLDELEKKIPELWRCHQNYLINLRYLDKISGHGNEGEGLVMINGNKIPVEKSRKSLLINEIEKYS